jgi:hypothetical protein
MLEYDTDLDQLMKFGKLKAKPPKRTNDSTALWKYLDVNIFSSVLIAVCVCYQNSGQKLKQKLQAEQ